MAVGRERVVIDSIRAINLDALPIIDEVDVAQNFTRLSHSAMRAADKTTDETHREDVADSD